MASVSPIHAELWRRLRSALGECHALISGTEHEIAAHAEVILGTDVVQRFLAEYYLPRHWGKRQGAISDEEAEALVVRVEAMARPGTPSTAGSMAEPEPHAGADEDEGSVHSGDTERVDPEPPPSPPPSPPAPPPQRDRPFDVLVALAIVVVVGALFLFFFAPTGARDDVPQARRVMEEAKAAALAANQDKMSGFRDAAEIERRGDAHVQAGEWSAARGAFSKARGKYQALAEEVALQQAVAKERVEKADALVASGSTKVDAEDYGAAIADLTEAIRLSPRSANAHYRRGIAHHKSGNPQQGIVDLTKAIALDSNDAYAYWWRAVARAALGETDDAVADYNRAEALFRSQKQTDLANQVRTQRQNL